MADEDRLRLLERIADRLNSFIAYIDSDFRYQYNNAQYQRWFSTGVARLRGRTVREVVGEERWREVAKHYHHVLAGHRTSFISRFDKNNASMGWGKIDLIPDIGTTEKVIGVFILVTDVTDLKETESKLRTVQEGLERNIAERAEQLREREAHLRIVTEAVPAGIAFFDSHQSCAFSNKTFARWFSSTPEKIVGKPISAVLPSSIPKGFLASARSGQTVSTDLIIPAAAGQGRAIELRAVPQGFLAEEKGITLLAYDLTQRNIELKHHRNVHKKMVEAQRLESLGLLTRGLAHDFTNMLHAINGNIDLAAKTLSEGSAALGFLGKAEKTARQARDFCSELLAYSGKTTVQQTSVDLKEVCREMAELVRSQPELDADITLALDSNVGPIRANLTQMRQVLMNLLMNAAQAGTGSENQVRVSLSRLRSESPIETKPSTLPPGDYICCEVSDNGIGMDELTRDRLFEPFFTTKSSGRGLGLAAVHGIIEGHGGGIEVLSEPGLGSSLRIYLPELGRGLYSASTPEEELAWTGSGLALVIDDDQMVLEVSAESLRQFGFDVFCASGGKQAMQFVDRHPKLELVVLDLMMPDMDGHETFANLRRLRPHLPVIINSGFPEQAQSLLQQDHTTLLQKPWFPEELRAAAQRLLQEVK